MGTQPGLDMAHPHLKLSAHQRCSHGGVHISVNQDKVGAAIGYHRLETSNDLGGLVSMAAPSHVKIPVARGHVPLAQEDVGHIAVVVLTGMNQRLSQPAESVQRSQDGSSFHEIGASSNDVKNMHATFSRRWIVLGLA